MVTNSGDVIAIPVSQANNAITDRITDQYLHPYLVWSEVSATAVVASAVVHGQGSTAALIVTPGPYSGNAVVAVRDDANHILWSWHIWNVGTTTDLAAITANTTSGWFMDRNLGATTITLDAVGSKGLFYQWGRKDPFPGSTTMDGHTETTLYDSETGNPSVLLANGAVPIATSILHPLTFYRGTNWTNATGSLWSGTAKTAYDPCPPGYVMPRGNPMGGNLPTLTTTNFRGTGTYRGRVYNAGEEYGACWPIAGARLGGSGQISYLNGSPSMGFYWTGTESSDTKAWRLDFTYTNQHGANNYPDDKTYGQSVRCVRE
jgi:hypothetical protein